MPLSFTRPAAAMMKRMPKSNWTVFLEQLTASEKIQRILMTQYRRSRDASMTQSALTFLECLRRRFLSRREARGS